MVGTALVCGSRHGGDNATDTHNGVFSATKDEVTSHAENDYRSSCSANRVNLEKQILCPMWSIDFT